MNAPDGARVAMPSKPAAVVLAMEMNVLFERHPDLKPARPAFVEEWPGVAQGLVANMDKNQLPERYWWFTEKAMREALAEAGMSEADVLKRSW